MESILIDKERHSSGAARVMTKNASRWLVLLLNLAALFVGCYVAVRALRKPLSFDDAFMFQRYAANLREGIGISWNPDEIRTGGMTSMGWFLFAILLSFLPMANGHALMVGSLATGVAAIMWLSWRTSRLSRSFPLNRFWLVLPLLALLLFRLDLLKENLFTGMDTMLSFAANGMLSCAIWKWCTNKDYGSRQAAVIGLLGAWAVIVRPENGIVAVLAPMLAALFLLETSRRKELFWAALSFTALLGTYLFLYHAYFHEFLPLSFYMKAQHPYRGYAGTWRWLPETYIRAFLQCAIPILAFPLVCIDRKSARIAAVFLIPIAITFAYLETVTQIMGHFARFYVPYLASVLVTAFWMSDHALQRDWKSLISARRVKIVGFGVLMLVLLTLKWGPVERWSAKRLSMPLYAAPALITSAGSPLPQRGWFPTITLVAEQVMGRLPEGSVVAATEVGLIGVAAPRVSVIDLSGLNDNDTALHGFDMDRLLDRDPLIIWFPHDDYTWQRQAMFCSPRLLPAYVVVGGGAFNYSIAIRRDSVYSAQVMRDVEAAFKQLYPDKDMKAYLVTSISCAR